ncbi:MAG: hypothetical protein IJV22_00845 [Bacteroidales bacterium]|nr:hypothetical protein [Bacteroidales bacterium]
MIRLFKTNDIAQVVIIVLATALLWTPSLLHPQPIVLPEGFAPLYHLAARWLMPLPRIATLVALLLIILEGVLLNVLLYNEKMLPQNTLLPTLLYIVGMSAMDTFRTLTPLPFVNLCLLGILNQMVMRGNNVPTLANTFNSAALIAIAALFYTPALLLLIPLIIMFTIHKLYSWRDWTVLLLGLLAPMIALWTYYFMTDGLTSAWQNIQTTWQWHFEAGSHVPLRTVISNVYYLLFLIVVLIAIISPLNERQINYRKNTAVVLWPLLATAAMSCFDALWPFNPQLAAIPLAFAGTIALLNIKKRTWIADTALLLLIAAALFG